MLTSQRKSLSLIQ